MSENIIKWVLFIVLSLFMPLLLAAPMAGNFYIPLVLMGILSLEYWIMLFNLNPFAVFVIGQLLAYGFVIYFASKYVARRIYKIKKYHSNLTVLIIVLCFIFISFVPVYGFESGENLYQTYHTELNR